MTDTQRTPLPLTYERKEVLVAFEGRCTEFWIRPIQASIRYSENATPETLAIGEARATYIVKACNAHEGLVKALRGLVSEIDYLTVDGTLRMSDVESNAAYCEARRVLAGLEEK